MSEAEKTTESVTALAIRAGFTIGATTISNPVLAGLISLAPEISGTLKAILGDFVRRSETPHRFQRALSVTNCVVNGVFERLIRGDELRTDAFFRREPERSPSDEIYEAALEACIVQYEERKIPFIARIYENAVFSDIASGTINSILAQATERTWRQYVLLSALSQPESASDVSAFFRRSVDVHAHNDAPHLRADLERLIGRATGLVTESAEGISLSPNGVLFIEITGLREVPREEIESITHALRDPSVITQP